MESVDMTVDSDPTTEGPYLCLVIELDRRLSDEQNFDRPCSLTFSVPDNLIRRTDPPKLIYQRREDRLTPILSCQAYD